MLNNHNATPRIVINTNWIENQLEDPFRMKHSYTLEVGPLRSCLAPRLRAIITGSVMAMMLALGAVSPHLAGTLLTSKLLNRENRYSLQTFAGSHTVNPATIKLPAQISVLLLPDHFSEPEWKEVMFQVSQLASLKDRVTSFRVHALLDGTLRSWETFPKQILDELVKLKPLNSSNNGSNRRNQELKPGSEVQVYQDLGIHLPKPKVAWETLLLFFPENDVKNADLKSFCSAYLADKLSQEKFRLVHWRTSAGVTSLGSVGGDLTKGPPVGQNSGTESVFASVAKATCGAEVTTMEELSEVLSLFSCSEVAIPEVVLPKGSFQYKARLIDSVEGETVSEFPAVAQARNGPPVSPKDYSRLLQTLKRARHAAGQRDMEALRSSIGEALNLNPLHPPTLRFAARIYRQQEDWKTALQLTIPLATLVPRDASIFSDIGDLYFNLREWEKSAKAYRSVLEINPGHSRVMAKLIGIQEQQGNILQALREVQSALSRYPSEARLYFRQGSLLEKIGRLTESLGSYQKALKLSPDLEEGYLSIARIHLSQDQHAKAHRILKQAVELIPSQYKLHMRYAKFCEKQGFYQQAIAFYRQACRAEPNLASAHFRIAKLQRTLDKTKEALATLEEGLKVNPRSLQLHQLRCDLLTQSNQLPAMRKAVEHAAVTFPGNSSVLAKLAEVRDVFGDRAAEGYELLAKALEQDKATVDQLEPVLERGLVVALRDGDRIRAARLARRLVLLGRSEIPDIEEIPKNIVQTGMVVVPGGIRGLSQAAIMHGDTHPDVFVSEYVSTLVRRTYGDSGESYLRTIRHYFKTIAELRAIAKSKSRQFQILIDTDNKASTKKAKEVLTLLGWAIRQVDGRMKLELGTDEMAALRQTYLQSLGVDEMEMKSKLEGGGSYLLTIADQEVPVPFDEKFWLRRFFHKPYPSGGLLEALLDNTGAIRLFGGLLGMNHEARRLVLDVYPPKDLLEKYADMLLAYGSAISVKNKQLLLPGGAASIPRWEALVGVSPKKPKQFIRRLLSHELGKPLAYYHSLINLPVLNQNFLTHRPGRLANFYEVFQFNGSRNPNRRIVGHRNRFKDFGRELPVDQEGRVHFPGSARIWTLPPGQFAKLEEEVPSSKTLLSQTVSPENENKILISLHVTDYQVGVRKYKYLENFLAVVHIQRHWKQPMDESTALLLAQSYPKYSELFPYLISLPQQSTEQLQQFFQAARNLEQFEGANLNNVLGSFHGLLHFLVLLSQNYAMDQSETESILNNLCEQFAKANTKAHIAAAGVGILHQISQALLPTEALPAKAPESKIIAPRVTGIDGQFLTALGGQPREVEFTSNYQTTVVDISSMERGRIQEVLQLQHIPSLTGLIELYHAALKIRKNGVRDKKTIQTFRESLEELHRLEQELENQLTKVQQGHLALLEPGKASHGTRQLRKLVGKNESSEGLSQLADALLGEFNRHLKDALVGWVYAYYFSPRDLAIAEDPLLTRKHQFHVTVGTRRQIFWPSASRQTRRLQRGNYLRGPLCQIPTLTGEIGLVKAEAGESIGTDPVVERFAAAQLSGVRSLPWPHLNPLSMHLVGLKIRLAREFIVQASLREALRKNLAEALKGLLGPMRMVHLLEGVSRQELGPAFGLLSSSDLYFLANELLKNPSYSSILGNGPVRTAWERTVKVVPPGQDRFFVGLEEGRSSHCKLILPVPYEDYSNSLLTIELSKRLGHMMLTLAEAADRVGLPFEAVALLAEPAVRHLALNAGMNTSADWRSAIQAMGRLQPEILLQEISTQNLTH